MSSTADAKERRKFRRYPAAVLKAVIKQKKGLFSEQWQDAAVVDYSEQGVAVVLDQEPELDQLISFKLVLEMDMGDITIDRIEGCVRNKVKNEKGWRSGLEFSDTSLRDCSEKLERITRLLEKSASVNERLQNQVHRNRPSN
jgi:hypothetical protein